MKTLLITKAVVETLAGLALLFIPSIVVSLVVGVPLEQPVGIVVARVGGVVLLTLGIACWVARNRSESRGAIRLIVALLIYDVAVAILLLFARLGPDLSGIALWPAIFLHSGLGAWSLSCLKKNPLAPRLSRVSLP